MRTASIVLALTLLASPGFGQGAETPPGDGTIRGTVTVDGNAGIGGAIVVLEPVRLIDYTDQSGAFAFDRVPPGTYTLRISIGAFEARQEGIRVEPASTVVIDKRVPDDFRVVMTTTVSAASRVQEQRLEAPATVGVVTEATIALEGGSGQIPALLAPLAGAEYVQSGVYNIEFNSRGFNGTLSRRVQVLLDGRDLAAPENKNQEWISVGFLSSELERIELLRGPAAALYGANSINGVVAMTTTSPRGSPGGRARLTLGDLDTVIADVRWAGPVRREWYAKFVANHTRSSSFSRSRTQSVEYAGLPREVAPALADNHATSLNARFDKYPAGGRQLVLEGGFSQNDGGTYLTQGGRIGIVDSKRSWGRAGFNTSRWTAHAYLNTRHANQKALFAPVDYPTQTVQFKAEVQGNQRFARDRGQAVFGGSYLQEHVDSADASGRQTLYLHPVATKAPALFGQVDYALAPTVKVFGALRWDESTLHDAQVSPRAAVVYLPAEGHSLRLSYSRGFQVGNYTELFLSTPLAAPVDLSVIDAVFAPFTGGVPLGFGVVPVFGFGNPDLDVEQVKSIEVSYSGTIGTRARVGASVYRNRMRDFISDLLPGINPAFPAYRSPAALPTAIRAIIDQAANAAIPGLANRADGGPQIVYSNGNVGLVTSRGVELEAAFRPRPGWSFETSYTWFDFTIIDPVPGLEPKPNAPRHRASAGVTYGRGRLAASFRHRWVDAFTWASGIFLGPVPSYHVSDINASYRVTRRVELGANVSNLFDQDHYEMFGGDVLGRRALGHLAVTW